MIFNEISKGRYLMKPGYLILYRKNILVYGVTGSGVFVSLWDSKRKYSGCCSFLYPKATNNTQYTVKYGDIAIKHLIQSMQKEGSDINDLRAIIIGGGTRENCDFGSKNVLAVREILQEKSIAIISDDTGGQMGRKFIYNTESAENITMKVHNLRTSDWYPYDV